MGKRSDFKRREKDFYPTPKEAVLPLLSHLPPDGALFSEPCYGDGALAYWLSILGPYNLEFACELQSSEDVGMDYPSLESAIKWETDALEVTDFGPIDYIITNPPWDRKILHPMINHFRSYKPTWLLFDADWSHTKQASEYLKYCQKIISVGRIKWIPDSKFTGKDNCAWYLFVDHETTTQFVGR